MEGLREPGSDFGPLTRRPSLESRMFIASVIGVLVAVAIPLAMSLFGLRRRT